MATKGEISGPSRSASDGATKEFIFGGGDGILSKASVDTPVLTDTTNVELEGLSFYNMDLYESRERLDIFTEEVVVSRTEDDQFTPTMSPLERAQRTEEEEYDLYTAEVTEMAKQYGVWDDKEEIDTEFPTQEPYILVTERKKELAGKGWNKEVEQTASSQPERLDLEEEIGRICQPASTGQHFSVETNESLCFESYNPSYEDEPQPLRHFVVQEQGSEEVFEEDKMHFTRSEMPTKARLQEFKYSEESQEDPPVDEKGDTEMEEQHKAAGGDENEPPDVFCIDCKTPIRAFQKLFGPHKDHSVTQISSAAEEIKDETHKTMCKLEEQIAQMENFASHLEEIFITVEENFGRQEQNLEQHCNEVMQTLAQRYEEKVSGLEVEKKQKLEALYSQLISCGETLDISKGLIETAQEVHRNEDKLTFLQAVIPAMDRIEELTKTETDLNLSASMEFENSTIDFSDVRQMMDSINIVPAPSAPVINPQTPNSATSTSVRVCWSLFSDDTVEYYELFYKPVLENTTAEEAKEQDASMLKVKETYCTVTDLVPNTQYEFWVTALNTTGISPASEKAVYMTVPSPPFIKHKECRSCPNAALIRWESGNTNPVDSYTVELCEISRERNENAVTESIVGIPTCESLIQLQTAKRYLIYVRAVNIGGLSERSDSFIIQTTGTFFHLNEETAHPCLSISEDGFTMFYGDEDIELSDMTFSDNTFARCVAILGELIPVRGKHYWEVEVEETTEYRIGVAYQDTQRNGYLGGNNTSWCMRHVITPSRHKYEFLHNGWSPDIRITTHPKRIGVALDYDTGTLSFFNTDLAQHLYTYECQFLHYVHPCFALDNPGALTVHNGIEAPEYTQFS
ncbi:fibronectin type III and SPRY domain-containing protein 2 [Amia ocellicauda]|uniref:fibronectin type III and SPRY domain-containing protein 2 n=1 Tax=Amia ocellicauda TaxID=2972642 RepID=UPI003463F1A1